MYGRRRPTRLGNLLRADGQMNSFDSAFKRGLQFEGITLSEMCPCDKCEHLPDVAELHQFDNKDIERERHCAHCLKIINWYGDCVSKLAEYEKINNSIKSILEGAKA